MTATDYWNSLEDPRAQAKVRGFEDRLHAIRAIVRDVNDRRAEVRTEITHAEIDLGLLEVTVIEGGFPPPPALPSRTHELMGRAPLVRAPADRSAREVAEAELAATRAKVATLRAEEQRLSDQAEALRRRSQSLGTLCQRVRKHIDVSA